MGMGGGLFGDTTFGYPIHTGNGQLETGSPGLEGSGIRKITGLGALEASAVTVSSTGFLYAIGSGALSTETPVVEASGLRKVKGTGSLSSKSPSVTLTLKAGGAGVLTPAAPTLTGAGRMARTAEGSLEASGASISAVGSIRRLQAVTGQLACSIAVLEGVGEAVNRVKTGTGDFSSGSPVLTGAGTSYTIVTGAGLLEPGPIDLEGLAATFTETAGQATGGIITGAPTLEGIGAVGRFGAGILSTDNVGLSGVGGFNTTHTGEGAFATEAPQLQAVGDNTEPWTAEGALETQSLGLTGVGHRTVVQSGGGTLLLQETELGSESSRICTGQGLLETSLFGLEGSGGLKHTGTGSLDPGAVLLEAVLNRNHQAQGALTTNTPEFSNEAVLQRSGAGILVFGKARLSAKVGVPADEKILYRVVQILHTPGHLKKQVTLEAVRQPVMR